jgi:hypothetical protein
VGNQNDVMRNKLLKEIDELAVCESAQRALDKVYPKTGDKTDYANWLKGSMAFARDNEDVLKTTF